MGARGRRGLAAAFVATLALLAATALAPTPAYASISDDVNEWMCGVLRDCANWIFGAQAKVLASIGVDGVLSAPFETMLGSAGSASLYGIAHGVWQSAVLPIGCGVLSLVFTVQLIHISQRMDGNASMPGVREVVFLLVFFAVMLFLVQNSFELMRALYEVARLAIRRASSVVGSGGAMDLTEVSVVTEDDDVAALLAMIVVALVSWLVVIVAYVVALVVTWAARDPDLHDGGALADTAGPHGPRGHPPGRGLVPAALRGDLSRRHHHARAARRVPRRARRARRGQRGHRHGRGLGRGRAQLRPPVHGHVRAARAQSRQVRQLGARRPGRIGRERGRRGAGIGRKQTSARQRRAEGRPPMADTNHEGRQRVYLTVHENFVREDIHYQDWKTGEERSFNLVTLPMGTVVDGEDLGGWQFSALFVDESRFKGEHWRDVPLLADREVWLRRSVLDADGNPIPDENGRNQVETRKVPPQAIKEALIESRRRWAELHQAPRPLAEHAQDARACSEAMRPGAGDPQPETVRGE